MVMLTGGCADKMVPPVLLGSVDQLVRRKWSEPCFVRLGASRGSKMVRGSGLDGQKVRLQV